MKKSLSKLKRYIGLEKSSYNLKRFINFKETVDTFVRKSSNEEEGKIQKIKKERKQSENKKTKGKMIRKESDAI